MNKNNNKNNKEISFNFPGRIQMCPLDFEAFNFERTNLVGGGGYGISIKLAHFISLKYNSEKDNIISCNVKEKIQLIEYILKIMKKRCNVSKNVSINVTFDNKITEHSGIGTNSSLICACVYGLNELFESNLSKEEMINIVKTNYFETENNKLVPGLTTGVSFQSFFNGGFVVVGDDGNLIFNKKLNKNFRCFLIDPMIRRNINSIEDIQQLENSRKLDKDYRYKKAFNFLMKVIPALILDDYTELSKYNYQNQLFGGQKAVIESYPNKGEKILKIISLFKKEDFIVGVSSCGPNVFVLTTNTKEALKIIKENKLNFIELQIQNEPI